MKQKIVICGAGRVGMSITEHLSNEGFDITVIDANAEALQKITELYDVQGVLGLASYPNVLDDAGIKDASAYYESLHETPLIANTIARKKLYEMNRIISDTAEYGCYLFDHGCRPLLENFFRKVSKNIIGDNFNRKTAIDNKELILVNELIRTHPIEIIGKNLRDSMTNMKKVV